MREEAVDGSWDPERIVRQATRYLFFTGKGGVGKTSHACATAVALADAGRRVLLVSTDPASNLSQVLGEAVGPDPVAVLAVPGLAAVNLDPAAATLRYREGAVAPFRGHLPEVEVRQMEEQLSGACTTEIATFDAFTVLLADPGASARADHIVFDTAPTGHTLRLLQLPTAWSDHMARTPGGVGCLGPAAGQEDQRRRFERALAVLQDPGQTTLYLVARPEPHALEEAARTARELDALGIAQHRLVVNGVFRASDPGDPLARELERQGRAALAGLPEALLTLPTSFAPLRAGNVVGVPALRAFHARDEEAPLPQGRFAPNPAPDPGRRPDALPTAARRPASDAYPPLASLVDELSASPQGLLLVMGKGGVGKTTLAAALAVGLADRGHAVHLATTDPAAHLEHALPEAVPGVRVSRIDPVAEADRYRNRVMERRAAGLDPDARRLLAEDLASPCTEEVAVFHAFTRLVNEGRRGWVILDTAPTGHTLLLLDTAGAYHREVLRNASGGGSRVTTPLMRLQDPEHARILLATLAESTPVEEAHALQEDLRRAGIEPWGWIVNRSLAAADPADPLLAARARAERPHLDRVHRQLSSRLALVPQALAEPVGAPRLRSLLEGGSGTGHLLGRPPLSPSLHA